jgi:hypothetical protein
MSHENPSSIQVVKILMTVSQEGDATLSAVRRDGLTAPIKLVDERDRVIRDSQLVEFHGRRIISENYSRTRKHILFDAAPSVNGHNDTGLTKASLSRT